MNEILDLQRDLHANDVLLCGEYTFEIRTLFMSLSLLVRKSLTARGRPPPTYGSATFFVGVLAVEMLFRVTHGTAGSSGISIFFLEF